jgi:hypothetical protein
MPKKNIEEELIKSSFTDIADLIKGRNPLLENLKTYHMLQNYFEKAEYILKTKGNKTTLSINHRQFYILKINENMQTSLIKSLKMTNKDNNLEAKIVFNIQFINNELKIHATKNHNNKYYCDSVSYGNFFLYQKEKSTYKK